MSQAFEVLAAGARERFPEQVLDVRRGLDMPVVETRRRGLVEVLTWLRDDHGFEMLTDLSGVDRLPDEPRLEVNYHLLDLRRLRRVRVKVRVGADDPHVPSVVGVWPGADWQEREVFDLFGVVFDGHPDLRRLLMPEEWEGHPLRKDYPVGGVPVEYRIEPAYVGEGHVLTDAGRAAAGGPPPRLVVDRGRRSLWTWTGPPAKGVRSSREPETPLPDPTEPTDR